MMGGKGEFPPVGGSKGPEPLASPNVLHWVGWLPGTTRCAAGPAVPAVPAPHGAPPRRARGNARGAASLRFVASDAGNRCCPASDGAFRESLQPQRGGLRPLREALWLSIVCTIQVSNPLSVEYSPIRRHLLDPQRRKSSIIPPSLGEPVSCSDSSRRLRGTGP